MKKLALLMAVLMLAVAAFTVSAFEDVAVEDACFDAVNTLVSLNVIKGKTETEFAPEDPVTREQMAMLFTRLYTTINFENGENLTPFTDLDDPYYNSVIAWCYDAKVINGTSLTTFEPKAHILYQDGLTMAARLLGYTDLTYPLGYVTKARQIGLSAGLEDVAYDQELTRGQVAILLYNALEAEGKEVITENVIKYYNGYPILESVNRNFEIALDVYNFKSETYQIVGTENFNLAGYNKGSSTTYNLVKIVDDEVVGTQKEYEFEALGLTEETAGDAYVLAYLDVLYRGESLDDKKAIVLSAVVNSNLDSDNEIAVYYEEKDGKAVANKDKVLVNGKKFAANEKVYEISNTGAISAVTDLNDVPAFFQANAADQGAYAQLTYDVNKDGEADYAIILPMAFTQVTKITSKGVYTIGGVNFDTAKEDCTLILNTEVAKNDYVLTFKLGKYTVVEEVIEPVVTTITRKTGTAGNYKYTLATGDVVTAAKDNNPLEGTANAINLTPSINEISLYIVNDKIVFTDAANATGYTPNQYAFFVSKGDKELYVDPEDGSIQEVKNAIAYFDGKAVTIPVIIDNTDTFFEAENPQTVITITGMEDGKYEVVGSIQKASDTYELQLGASSFWYDTRSKVYKVTAAGKTYIVDFDENSELFVETLKNSKYDKVQCYTMANMPQFANNGDNLVDVILRKNLDADDKVTSYTFVVGYSRQGGSLGDNYDHYAYRIVLSKGLEVGADNVNYTVYEVLNPYTGAVETIKDSAESNFAEGTIVRAKANNSVESLYAANGVFSAGNFDSGAASAALMQIQTVINDNLATAYKGTAMNDNDTANGELVLNNVKVVEIDINDDGDYVIDFVENYEDLEGKVVRTFTTSGLAYKVSYMVVVPHEWATAAGFTVTAYDDAI